MKTLIDLLEIGPANIQDIQDMSNNALIISVESELSPLDQFVKAKALIESLELYMDSIKQEAIKELDKNTSTKEKTISRLGASISIAEVGTKWHYDKTGDSSLYELDTQAKAIKDKMDERQKMLKNLSAPLKLLNEETGEVETIYPAYKTSTTGLKISFKK